MKKTPEWIAKAYVLLFACLPWSVEFDFGHWSLSLPSEPLIGLLSLGLLGCFIQDPKPFWALLKGNRFWQISLIWVAWMVLTACFSTLPVVSWKYCLVTIAHIWVFGVGIARWPDIWARAFRYFAFSMGGVAVYTLIHHGFYHFRSDQALLAPMPFFPENTMWAATLVLVLTLVGIPLVFRWFGGANKQPELPTQGLLVLTATLLIALVFSACRAAWLSVLGMGFGWFLLFLNKKKRILVLLGLFGLLFGLSQIPNPLKKDVSAMERLNRWSCALRMSQDRPFLGFGPGTFQFQYFDYQRPEEMTRISLTEPVWERNPDTYGRGGGAHSEYLRQLAESGWPSVCLWIVLLGLTCSASVSLGPAINLRYQPYVWALLSFVLHGLVNDFLHDARVAALIWGCFALISVSKKEDETGFGFFR